MARGYPDFEGNKLGLYLIPEWAAKEGNDILRGADGNNKATGTSINVAYTVTAGKKLYITQLGMFSYATLAADRDKDQICVLQLFIAAIGYPVIGSSGGGFWNLPKPMVALAGQVVNLFGFNFANHNCNMGINWAGFEIEE